MTSVRSTIRSPTRSAVLPPFGGSARQGIIGDPIALWEIKNGVLQPDSVGKPISELYPLLDPTIQSIVSADGGLTRRPDAEIYALARISEFLNMGPMVGRGEGRGIAMFPVGTHESTLVKACKYFSVTYGEQYYATDIEGKSVFGEPHIGAYSPEYA